MLYPYDILIVKIADHGSEELSFSAFETLDLDKLDEKLGVHLWISNCHHSFCEM